jgi:hypothetical protein
VVVIVTVTRLLIVPLESDSEDAGAVGSEGGEDALPALGDKSDEGSEDARCDVGDAR